MQTCRQTDRLPKWFLVLHFTAKNYNNFHRLPLFLVTDPHHNFLDIWIRSSGVYPVLDKHRIRGFVPETKGDFENSSILNYIENSRYF